MWSRVFNPHSEVLLIIYMTSLTGGMKKKKKKRLEQLSQWITENLLLIDHSVVLHASTTIYRTRAATKIVQRTFSTGSSMEMRPEAVQYASICGSRNEDGENRVKQLIAT